MVRQIPQGHQEVTKRWAEGAIPKAPCGTERRPGGLGEGKEEEEKKTKAEEVTGEKERGAEHGGGESEGGERRERGLEGEGERGFLF